MGNSTSAAADGEDDEALLDPFDGADTLGYRVLGVQPDSPASKAGLVSFLDFLVGANGEMLLASGDNVEQGDYYPDVDLPSLLEEHKGKKVEFLVWNMKSQSERLVDLIPDDTWGGAGLLGVTIRLDNYAGAEERLVRVLEVDSPQSPAAMAGLVPFHDYILGTTSETLQDTVQLSAILADHVDQVVELYVYNSQSDLVRTVALMPTLSWGGPGLLGAAVGTGYLHRFPSKAQETTGASVARKVRYLGTNPPAAPNSASQNENATTATTSNTPVLQLEPQLEMEAAPHDDDDDDESESEGGSSFSTPQPPRRKVASPPDSSEQPQEATAPAPQQEAPQSTTTTTDEPSLQEEDPHTFTKGEEQQRVPPPVEETSNSARQASVQAAAALFAGPAPGSPQ